MNRLQTVTITGHERASVGYEAIFMHKTMFIVLHDLGNDYQTTLIEDIMAITEDIKRVIIGVCKTTVFCCDREGYFSQLVCEDNTVSIHTLGASRTFKDAQQYWKTNKAL